MKSLDVGLQKRKAGIPSDLSENGQASEQRVFREKFDPRDYIQTYYPESIDTPLLLRVLQGMHGRHPSANIDIRDLAANVDISHETAENLLIFDFQRVVAKNVLKAFPRDHINVLDVGGGPTIYQHIAISLEAGSITHSEFLEQNRDEAQKWVSDAEGAYNWDAYLNLMQKMLQNDPEYQDILNQQTQSEEEQIRSHALQVKNIIESPDITELKKYVRERLNGHIVHGDVFQSDLGMRNQNRYDVVNSSSRESSAEVITSNFTVESATGDRSVWERGMRNIMGKVKPGGFLALTAIRNAEWYKVGEEKMPAVKIDEGDITSICKEGGFQMQELRILKGSHKETVGYDGMIFVLARKNGET